MEIRIPRVVARTWNSVNDFLATYLLPPPRPTGLRLFGHDIIWTDVGTAAWGLVMAAGMWLWTGNAWWFLAVALSMVFWAVLIP